MKTSLALRYGFTLLEIFLVILILSVLTGISIPRFSDSCRNLILKENVQIFLSQIRYARKLALIKGTPYYVLLSPESLEIRVGDSVNLAKDKSLFLEKYKLSTGLSLESDPLFITFYPQGNSDPFVFKIKNEKNVITLTGNGKPDDLSEEETPL